MMPAPHAAAAAIEAVVQHPGMGVSMDVDPPAVGPLADEQQQVTRRSSSDGGDPSPRPAGSLDSLASGSSDEYSDTGSSSGDDDDVSDDETLADRHARSLGKRAAGASDQGQPAKRRRSSSDSGGSTGSGSSRRRRNLFPAIRRSQRCGSCHTCLNPQLKKACQTVRERMMKEMQGSSKSQRAGKAAAGPQQQQVPLSPAGSGELDQNKYVDLLTPFIDGNGALKNADQVAPFIKSMPSFRTTVARILPASVLSLTTGPSLLADFMAGGGVEVLATWMLDAMGEDTEIAKQLLTDILTVLQKLPVTRAFVQSTKSCKVIGALRKHDNADVCALARQVVDLWMKVVSSGGSTASSSKSGSRSTGGSAGGAAATAAGSSVQASAAKTAPGQGAATMNGAAAKPPGRQVQMVSDNDLFKPAAPAAKGKTPLRLGMGQPKKSQGVQLVDTAEAGKLLSGGAGKQQGASATAAGGSKALPSQRSRLSSPPLTAGSAAAAAAAAAAAPQPRVVLELQITPEQTVKVTLRVAQPPAGRLPGLRRTGFGSSLGGRGVGGSATPGHLQAAMSGAAWGAGPAAGSGAAAAPGAAADRKPRKPKKRVTWKSERELESVRWFIKDDPAVNARQDAHLTDEQMRALATAQHQHHHDFQNLILMEHQHEKIALEAHHREEEERRLALVAAMQPGCPWHGTPPPVAINPDWQVAGGEDSAEAQHGRRPVPEVMHQLHCAQYAQPLELEQLHRPLPANFNMAHHDPAVQLIPLFGLHQQPAVAQPQPVGPSSAEQTVLTLPLQQVPQHVQQPPILQQQLFGGQPIVLQQPQVSQPPPQQQQQQPVTYTLGQGVQSQPQLVMQPLAPPQQTQQQLPQVPQQHQQHQPAPAPVVSGPPSSSDNSQLMQVLQSLSQSGLLQQQQQQPPQQQQLQPQQLLQQLPQQQQQQQQPAVSQMQLQAPPPQQLLQAQPVGLPLPAGSAGQVVTLQGGVQLVLPPGVTPLPGQPMQLPPGFVLAPPQQQAPPPQPQPMVIYPGQPGMPPPHPHGMVPVGAEERGDYGPPPGPGAPWGGLQGPPHREGPYGRGGGRGEGAGGPQRHGRGGRGGRGGPYHREDRAGPPGSNWQGNSRVCKFFNTVRGCSKGDACDFRHMLPGTDVDVRNGH